MKNKKWIILGVLIVTAVVFVIGARFYKEQEVQRLSFIAQENFNTFVKEHSPRKGATAPKVYIVEFLDPECESCRMFHPIVDQLVQEYPGKVQLVVRYAPFHANSKFAIKILEAARKQNRYWETLELLFKHQPEWGSHHDPRPDLIWTYLPEVGLNIDQIKMDLENPETDQMILADLQDVQTLKVRGTPTFFVNGKEVGIGYDEIKQAIEAEL